MEFIHKIRALQIGKRKTFRRVLLAEILLILLGIVGLFGRNEVYEYPSEGVTVNTGVYQDNMTIEHISLKPGLYRIQLHYDTDTNMKNFCIVEDDTVGYRMLRNSGEHLYQGLHETDYPLWLRWRRKLYDLGAYHSGNQRSGSHFPVFGCGDLHSGESAIYLCAV